MPRIRKSKTLTVIKKQKQQIASRLMQISLKMDDYIYKDIPISEQSAEMFIKEVTGYKDKCFDDKRSLQVIEKLTRCMKGIILEQQELRQKSGSAPVSSPIAIVDVESSVLASSVDEHLTQFTQNIEVNKILESQQNDIELCDDGTHINKHLNDNETQSIDLCNNSKPANKNEEDLTHDNQISKEKKHTNDSNDLQRAVSILTIRDEEDPLSIETFAAGDYSQSILMNFECSNIENDKITNKNKIVCSQDFEEFIQPPTIIKEHIITKIKDGRSRQQNNSNMAIETPDSSNISHNIEKVQTKRARKPNQKYNNDNPQPKKQNFVRKNKQDKKEVVKKNKKAAKTTAKNNKPSDKLNKIAATKEQNATSQNNRTNENTNQQASATIHQSNAILPEIPTLNSVGLKIYNKDVANDLSWIENIRFVREIAREEHLATFLDDGFWEDYTLPNNWNWNDFIYT